MAVKKYLNLTYKGITYERVEDAADEYGINRNTLRGRLQKGMSLEEAIDYKKCAIEFRGKVYINGLREIADDYGITRQALYNRVNKGMSIEDAVNTNFSMQYAVTFEGKTYKSMKELAKAYGIEYTKLMKRMETHGIHEAIYGVNQIEERKVIYKGKTYNNLVELAKQLDLSIDALKNRLKNKERNNENIEKAVQCAIEYKKNCKEIIVLGVSYSSIYKAGEIYGIGKSAIDSRKKKVEDALEILGLKGRFLRLRVGQTICNIKIKEYLYTGRDGLEYFQCKDTIKNKEIILNSDNLYSYCVESNIKGD